MEELPNRLDTRYLPPSLIVPDPNDAKHPVVLYGTGIWLEKIRRQLQLVGPTEARVIITGETGTGKTTLARAIHLCHPSRRMRPFRRTNVGALVPELAASQLFGHVQGAFTGASRDHIGIVEESQGGTLFMDEVAAAPANVQIMLLTLLESRTLNPVGADPRRKPVNIKEIDVRFIAATTVPIDMLRASKDFRPDLFFRIAEYHIEIPPLRDCREEIPQLAQAFLLDCQSSHRGSDCKPLTQIEKAASERLQAYHWPGNIRELQYVIKAAVVRSREDKEETVLRASHLQLSEFAPPSVKGIDCFDQYQTWQEAKEAFHCAWVEWALKQCGTAAEVGRRFRVDQKTIKKYRDSVTRR